MTSILRGIKQIDTSLVISEQTDKMNPEYDYKFWDEMTPKERMSSANYGRGVTVYNEKTKKYSTKFPVLKNQQIQEAISINDDDWYEIDPSTNTVIKQRGPEAFRAPFGQREIKLPNGNIVMRGMSLKMSGLDKELKFKQYNLDEEEQQLEEDLRKWFKEKWVRFGPDGKIRGDCARGDDSEGKPKCLPQSKAQSLGKKGRKYAASKKRREDPNPERSGKAINVATKKKSNEGVAEAINPDITNPEFSHQQQIGDYLYVARYWSKGLKITAYHGNKQIGYAELMYQSAPFDDFADPKTTPKRIWLESEWTRVDPKYQRQGIMSTMYAYAKMLGNSVKPSQTRSDDAKAAWKSWRQSGDAQHLTREGVAEGSADKTVKVVKRGGKPIGEIGIDPEASPGNGSYYVKLYDGSVDLSGFDTAEEALAELKYLVKQSVAEGKDDDNPVANAIYRRLMNQKPDLFTRYGLEVVAQAVEDVADSVGHLGPDDEIGSSDVSGWVRQVEQQLRNMGEGVAEAANPTDKITVDVPLMLRIMEYAREDAQDDMDLHDITEKLVELSSGGKTLSMSDYDAIVGMTAEQKLSELGAAPPTPPAGTANPTATTANTAPTTGSVSPDEQTALNKIQTNPTMKAQLDKLMTQANPAQTGQPMKLNPDQEDALEKIKANAGLKTQYDKIIQQANPQAKV